MIERINRCCVMVDLVKKKKIKPLGYFMGGPTDQKRKVDHHV